MADQAPPTARSRVLPYAVAAALSGAATATGAPLGLPLHDFLGGAIRPRPIPSALITAEGPEDVPGAIAAARSAGAAEVWMALPQGHRWLSDARPDPESLVAGGDGRIRFVRERGGDEVRLALPEGLNGVLQLDAAQLGPGTPSGLLAGKDVVIALADEAMGRTVSVPGRAEPVKREAVLAVALGATRAGGLVALPLPLAVALVALLAALWQGTLERRRLAVGSAWTLAAALASLGVCAGARRFGVDLPVTGLIFALAMSFVARQVTATTRALHALDDLGLRLGGRGAPRAAPQPEPGAPERPMIRLDPEAARVMLAQSASADALNKAEVWEDLLGRSGLPLGIFREDGSVLAIGEALSERMIEPLTDGLPELLTAAAGMSIDEARRMTAAVIDGEIVPPLPMLESGRELLLRPLGAGGDVGILAHVLDSDAFRHMRIANTGSLQSVVMRMRSGLQALQGRVAQLALEEVPERRMIGYERVQQTLEACGEILKDAEAWEAGDGVAGFVDPTSCVQMALATLPASTQAHFDLDLQVCPPVRARAPVLTRALTVLLHDVAEHSSRARVTLSQSLEESVVLRLQDDSGGLPGGAVAQLLREDGPIAQVRRALTPTGGRLTVENTPGTGISWVLSLRHA